MAQALYKAMKGAGTKERILTEILACITGSETEDLKKAFAEVSGGESLEDAIKGDTSRHYQKVLLLVRAGQSDEPSALQLKKLSPKNINEVINPSLAEQDVKEIDDTVRYAVDRAALFAELLHFSMQGLGTKDKILQRTLALRADTDLGSIKEKFEQLYGENLADDIIGDTLGDYRDLCLKFVDS
ncbi:hypothetical protein Aperf_G00000114251 [Anoplocephala perfoliata]